MIRSHMLFAGIGAVGTWCVCVCVCFDQGDGVFTTSCILFVPARMKNWMRGEPVGSSGLNCIAWIQLCNTAIV